MTQRTEITDEMVERYVFAYFGAREASCVDRPSIKRALEAALNPPQEPEIPVSPAMARAGRETYKRIMDYVNLAETTVGALVEVYRAMESKRREEEAQEARLGAPSGSYRPEVGHICGEVVRHHRRSTDDPKMYPRSHRRQGDPDLNKTPQKATCG